MKKYCNAFTIGALKKSGTEIFGFLRILITGISFILSLILGSCRKSNFLDKRPDQSQVVPQTLDDFQAMLDNDKIMNGAGGFGVTPALGDISCTDYFITDEDLINITPVPERNMYTWQKDIFSDAPVLDWNLPYRAVFYANNVLQGINEIDVTPQNQRQLNSIRGSALFYRAWMFYHLVQTFAPPYDSLKASALPGIPLRLLADINEQLERASLAETYSKIKEDLSEALTLLPPVVQYTTRPSKAAAHALLARLYLAMHKYTDAYKHADSCLQLYNQLIDYNELDTTISFPFEPLNQETIFYSSSVWHVNTTPYFANIPEELFNSYAVGDLRKKTFFSEKTPGIMTFTGSYARYDLFSGIATDEVLLTRAECLARLGNTNAALVDINDLLEKRFRKDAFTPLTETSPQEALRLIIAERRKELLMRGIRWSDLRRLNDDPATAQSLSRTVEGVTYDLPPGDLRYTMPVPAQVITLNPAIIQNPR